MTATTRQRRRWCNVEIYLQYSKPENPMHSSSFRLLASISTKFIYFNKNYLSICVFFIVLATDFTLSFLLRSVLRSRKGQTSFYTDIALENWRFSFAIDICKTYCTQWYSIFLALKIEDKSTWSISASGSRWLAEKIACFIISSPHIRFSLEQSDKMPVKCCSSTFALCF